MKPRSLDGFLLARYAEGSADALRAGNAEGDTWSVQQVKSGGKRALGFVTSEDAPRPNLTNMLYLEAVQPIPRVWKLQHVARVIADNNQFSHDWEDYMEAARDLDRQGLLDLSPLDASPTEESS